MKEKPNYAELEKRIDFTVLAGRIGQLTEQDNPQRKTVFTLLDKVREQICYVLFCHRTSSGTVVVAVREFVRHWHRILRPNCRALVVALRPGWADSAVE
jgi:hypothetical protein